MLRSNGWLRMLRPGLPSAFRWSILGLALTVATVASLGAGAQVPPSLPRLDINRAPIIALQTLPGIDATAAVAIVNGRPYREPDDLLRRSIIPAEVFEKLRNRIFAGPT